MTQYDAVQLGTTRNERVQLGMTQNDRTQNDRTHIDRTRSGLNRNGSDPGVASRNRQSGEVYDLRGLRGGLYLDYHLDYH